MKCVQVKFNTKNIDEDTWLGGIMVDDTEIICGCCGGTFEVDDIGKENIAVLSWVNISDAILGDD